MSLDECGNPAARAGTPKGLLPGSQPTTLKLIVNRLSRHKVSTVSAAKSRCTETHY